MCDEHTKNSKKDEEFEAPNYKIRTSPLVEWKFVNNLEIPVENLGYADANFATIGGKRVRKSTSELMANLSELKGLVKAQVKR